MPNPKLKRKLHNPLRRGDAEFYRELQEKSMRARVARNFEAEVMLDGLARLPARAHPTDAGFDLIAAEERTVSPHSGCGIRTGVHVSVPDGYFYWICARSSLIQRGLFCPMNPIDAGYQGELIVPLYNMTSNPKLVKAGLRLAQLVFGPVLSPTFRVVSEFTPTDRGTQGFGSSGQ
jgi:dUTP pyrophosphatase